MSKTYRLEQGGRLWLAFYDRSIRFWTVYEVDENDNQLSEHAEYYHNKEQLTNEYPFQL